MPTRCKYAVYVPAFITGAEISKEAEEHIKKCPKCQEYAEFLERMSSFFEQGKSLGRQMEKHLGSSKTKKKK